MSYTLIHQPDAHYAHLTFNGLFLGNSVTWDTHFYTLQGFYPDEDVNLDNIKQFIDIETISTDKMKLTIVLRISDINNSSIQKMMIMIKQYKALSLGRHEYG